jgi:hypothetical protein
MLVIVIIVFLVCQMPLAANHIILTYKPTLLYNKSFFIYNALISCLTGINLTVNFALLCFFGQHFRQVIAFMFGFRKELPDDAPNVGMFVLPAERNISMFQNILRIITATADTVINNDTAGRRRSSGNVAAHYDTSRKRQSMPVITSHYTAVAAEPAAAEETRRLMSLTEPDEILKFINGHVSPLGERRNTKHEVAAPPRKTGNKEASKPSERRLSQ